MFILHYMIIIIIIIIIKKKMVLQKFSNILGQSPQLLPLADVVILYNRMTVKGP